jgi:hypothetical protein
MRQKELTHYEKMAIMMFDGQGKQAYSGVVYNCKLIIDYIAAKDINCTAWVCMN